MFLGGGRKMNMTKEGKESVIWFCNSRSLLRAFLFGYLCLKNGNHLIHI